MDKALTPTPLSVLGERGEGKFCIRAIVYSLLPEAGGTTGADCCLKRRSDCLN